MLACWPEGIHDCFRKNYSLRREIFRGNLFKKSIDPRTQILGKLIETNLGFQQCVPEYTYTKSQLAACRRLLARVPTVIDFGEKSITSGCQGSQNKLKASYNRDVFLVECSLKGSFSCRRGLLISFSVFLVSFCLHQSSVAICLDQLHALLVVI